MNNELSIEIFHLKKQSDAIEITDKVLLLLLDLIMLNQPHRYYLRTLNMIKKLNWMKLKLLLLD